ncbi:uncharacterized protein LOC129601608 isoform X2 [Paramacrobiotus metropolitanus]|nr:uncharacterized protein LOC129601608 isoform X2 [Paramacrobiotus metropolitanus]XP_055356438.1 uncharacterized protein LOC129601608 isoform X2 [Paramacrobiotus metropolitanus]
MWTVGCVERLICRRSILRCLGVVEILAGLAVVCINLLVVYMIPYMDFAIVHSAIFFLCLLTLISGILAVVGTRPVTSPTTLSTCLAMHTVAACIGVIELLFLVCLLIFSHGSLSLSRYMLALIKKDHAPDAGQEGILAAFYLSISVSLGITGLLLIASAVLGFCLLQNKSSSKTSRSDIHADVRLLGATVRQETPYFSVAPPTRVCPKTEEASLVPMV